MTALLAIRDLHVAFRDDEHDVEVLNGVSFDVAAGSTVGLVGESGCGKSVSALSVMRLLPQPAGRITRGSILFEGQDLASVPAANMARIRGNRIAMIFQEPMTALNPVHRVGRQVEELLQLHRPELGAADRRRDALAMFERVGIPAARQRLDEYPHQLSGGMRQRVMIAMALALQPALLIADEPTTALDVTIQAQILDLIADLQRQHGMAVLLITHDLGVVAEVCSDVVVMYAGRIAERATAQELFTAPRHPYTRGLLASIPRLEGEPKTTLPVIAGMVPALTALPPGCRFGNRCPHVQPACTTTPPEPERVTARATAAGASAWSEEDVHAHAVACVRWRELPA